MTVEYDETGQPLSLIDLRPMDFGDILDGTIRVYRRNPWVFITILAVIVGLPVMVSQAANRYFVVALEEIGRSSLAGAGPDALKAFYQPEIVLPALVMGLAGIIMIFLAPLAQAAMVYAVSETMLGREVTFSDGLRATLPKLGTIVLAYLLYILIILIFFSPFLLFLAIADDLQERVGLAIGLFLLFPISFLFLFYFIVKYLFIPHAVMLDNVGAVNALRRSFGLTSGYWWRTFGIYLLVSFIVGIIDVLLRQIVVIAERGLMSVPSVSDALVIMIGAIIMTLIWLVVNPITLIATTLMYYDLRIRKEGFDLVLLAASLDGNEERARDPSEDVPVG